MRSNVAVGKFPNQLFEKQQNSMKHIALTSIRIPVIKVKLFPQPPASKIARKIREENMIAEVNQALNEWYFQDLISW